VFSFIDPAATAAAAAPAAAAADEPLALNPFATALRSPACVLYFKP
jgi:hypothetical protein